MKDVVQVIADEVQKHGCFVEVLQELFRRGDDASKPFERVYLPWKWERSKGGPWLLSRSPLIPHGDHARVFIEEVAPYVMVASTHRVEYPSWVEAADAADSRLRVERGAVLTGSPTDWAPVPPHPDRGEVA